MLCASRPCRATSRHSMRHDMIDLLVSGLSDLHRPRHIACILTAMPIEVNALASRHRRLVKRCSARRGAIHFCASMTLSAIRYGRFDFPRFRVIHDVNDKLAAGEAEVTMCWLARDFAIRRSAIAPRRWRFLDAAPQAVDWRRRTMEFRLSWLTPLRALKSRSWARRFARGPAGRADARHFR